MKQLMVIAALVITLGYTSGCVSLSRSDQSILNELRSYGISETDIQKKNPGLAGGMNILPGFGNFYLAAGTDESDLWLIGFLNLLTWPISVLWGVPEAVIDANTINKRETIYYYTYDRIGKQEFEKRKAEVHRNESPANR